MLAPPMQREQEPAHSRRQGRSSSLRQHERDQTVSGFAESNFSPGLGPACRTGSSHVTEQCLLHGLESYRLEILNPKATLFLILPSKMLGGNI